MTTDPAYRLLLACTCLECPPERQHSLLESAAGVTDWHALSTLAEEHGLSPLLYHHLTRAGFNLPQEARRELQALSLRHRLGNHARLQALSQIIGAFQQAGIRSLLLKGAALCLLLYPQPGLRPMSDLDVLVSRQDVPRARQLLSDLGYTFIEGASPADHRHISPASRSFDGYNVCIEIHHALHNEHRPDLPASLEDLTNASVPVQLEAGITAYAPGYDEMLFHLCQHMLEEFSLPRLIWVVDVVGFASRFSAEIDWESVTRRFPLVLNTLQMLHYLTPLPPPLVDRLALDTGSPPRRIGEVYQGWPAVALRTVPRRERGKILRGTLHPSEWWLRLHEPQGRKHPLWLLRIEHLLHLLAETWRRLSLNFSAHTIQKETK